MAKSVKTIFMDAVKVDLDAITAIKQVKRGPVIPIDRDIAVFPCAGFTTSGITLTDKNRVQLMEFDLVIGVTVLEEVGKTVEEIADDLDAAIETKLLKDGTSLAYSNKIRHSTSDVQYPTDDLDLGVLYAIYRVQIYHEYGDSTNPARG